MRCWRPQILIQPLLRLEVAVPAVIVAEVLGGLLELLPWGVGGFLVFGHGSLAEIVGVRAAHPRERVVEALLVAGWAFVLEGVFLAELADPLGLSLEILVRSNRNISVCR